MIFFFFFGLACLILADTQEELLYGGVSKAWCSVARRCPGRSVGAVQRHICMV